MYQDVSETQAERDSNHRHDTQIDTEKREQRRLQAMLQLLLATIQQDRSLTVDAAAQMVAHTRDSALRRFPGCETAYHLLWRPRIQRAMRERFQIQ